MPTPANPPERSRDVAIDVVRGLALLSMYVAHTAPSGGPLGLLDLSEWLTAPLFALLVGIGVALGAQHSGVVGELGRNVLRGLILIVLGVGLDRLHAPVFVVLVPLGVLLVLAKVLVRLPWLVVALVGVVAWWLNPEVQRHGVALASSSEVDARLLALLLPPYPMAAFVTYAAVGILLVRWWPSRGRAQAGVVLVGGGALVVLWLLRARDVLAMTPYDGSHQQIAFGAVLAATVTASVRLVCRPRKMHRLIAPVAWAGAMTLTWYCLQVGYLAYVAHNDPLHSVAAWRTLAVLVAGTLVGTVGWHLLTRGSTRARGPMEWMIGLLTRPGTGLLRSVHR